MSDVFKQIIPGFAPKRNFQPISPPPPRVLHTNPSADQMLSAINSSVGGLPKGGDGSFTQPSFTPVNEQFNLLGRGRKSAKSFIRGSLFG